VSVRCIEYRYATFGFQGLEKQTIDPYLYRFLPNSAVSFAHHASGLIAGVALVVSIGNARLPKAGELAKAWGLARCAHANGFS
jgi:hypothetical protein